MFPNESPALSCEPNDSNREFFCVTCVLNADVGEIVDEPKAPNDAFGLPNVAAPPKDGWPKAGGGPPKAPAGAAEVAATGNGANPVCNIEPCC